MTKMMRSLILKYRKKVKNEEFIKENQIINISKNSQFIIYQMNTTKNSFLLNKKTWRKTSKNVRVSGEREKRQLESTLVGKRNNFYKN